MVKPLCLSFMVFIDPNICLLINNQVHAGISNLTKSKICGIYLVLFAPKFP